VISVDLKLQLGRSFPSHSISDAKQIETEVQETADSTAAAATVTEQMQEDRGQADEIGWHCLVKIVSGEHKGKQGRLRKSVHGESLLNGTVYELDLIEKAGGSGLALGKQVSVDGESLEYGEGAGGMITALELGGWDGRVGGDGSFVGACFDNSDFKGIKFGKSISFQFASFAGDANFREASFAGEAYFMDAFFTGKADFDKASFAGKASFNEASFAGSASFDKASFTGDAHFGKAFFAGIANFNKASFAGNAGFSEASFTGSANFNNASVAAVAGFNKASFAGKAYFNNTSFARKAGFHSVIFTEHMTFKNAKFAGGLNLIHAQILSSKEWATFQGATISSDLYLMDAKVVDSSFAGALMGDSSIHDLDRIAYNGSSGDADHWLPSPYPTELGRSAENEKKSRGLCVQLGYLICQTVLGGGSGKNNGDDNDNDDSGDDTDDGDDGDDDTDSSADVVEAAGLPQVHCLWIADLKLIAYLGMLCQCKGQVAVSVRGELHALITLLRVQMDVQKQLLKAQTASAKGDVKSSVVRAANATKDVAIASEKNRRWRKLIGAGREVVEMANALTQPTVPTVQRRRTNKQVTPVEDVHVLELAAHLSELYEAGAELVANIVGLLEGGEDKETKSSASVSDLVEEAQRLGQDARMKLKESGTVEERLREFVTTMIAGFSDCFKESLIELKQRLLNVAKHHAHKTLDDGFTRLRTYPWWQRLWKTVMQFDTLELNKHVDEIEQVQNE
jgi:hypothetical protein